MNVLKMMQQAATMRREMREIQAELEKKTVEYSVSGGRVKVVARGDMSIESIAIDPQSVDPANVARLQELLVAGVNGALKAAKKKAGGEMSKMAGALGLGNLIQ
ncbi:MAG: YbaB/EbfC family nucleoid-associated protein [Verrucomicrobiota bacterium]|nr:YbaB/EbfC family nucleoid-associated protein [Verrucomicrobiota bacterium]